MKMFTKGDFGRMGLAKLESEKTRFFNKIIKGDEPRKHRNMLYDLLGVIEEKVKFEGMPVELKLA